MNTQIKVEYIKTIHKQNNQTINTKVYNTTNKLDDTNKHKINTKSTALICLVTSANAHKRVWEAGNERF